MLQISGIAKSVFWVEKGVLVENGTPRRTFRFSNNEMELKVDVAPIVAVGHPKGTRCCRACEWVHSKLHIHFMDWLCCLGGCRNDGPKGDFPIPEPDPDGPVPV